MRTTQLLLAQKEVFPNSFKRAQRGLFGGKRIHYGNRVSENDNKTRRRWLPNVQKARVYSEAFGTFFKMKVTTAALRTIDKKGGLDQYLLNTKDKELGMFGVRLRNELKAKLAGKWPVRPETEPQPHATTTTVPGRITLWKRVWPNKEKIDRPTVKKKK
ncbi:7954_t:CDS:1 [Paraglomus occultum]|uniref:Large ribosomal subunit protein bL28c n=1 Tax=Paraglomus occultum TaxID=144539 RepID=A0A9N9B4B7_9GLOM|nr:7954_t:CDS:1 [Paraglomus occultum]